MGMINKVKQVIVVYNKVSKIKINIKMIKLK
jgi:hypothetical protein